MIRSAVITDLFGGLTELNPLEKDKSPRHFDFDESKRGSCALEEALIHCINDKGKVDVRYMAHLAAVSEDDILAYYGGKTIFQKPDAYVFNKDKYGDWVLESEYVRGNIRDLLREAEKCHKSYPRFAANIALLKSRMPARPSAFDIHMKLGSSWIYTKHVANFVQWLLELRVIPQVYRAAGKWKLKMYYKPMAVLNHFTYGTKRVSAVKLIENLLNAVTTKIKDEVPADNKSGVKMVVNMEETMLAQSKAQEILLKFQEWLSLNPKVIEELVNEYCNTYAYAMPHYSGDMLTLADMNPAVTPYKHQRDAALRIILNPNSVLCHDVGSGKTFCYIIAAHEMYRMGISMKNMIVVPNATFAGTVNAHRTLYPQDKILTISPDDFKPSEKEAVIEKIKTGDYVAIYIAYSKFDMLCMSKQYYEKKFDEEISEALAKSNSCGSPWERDAYSNKYYSLKKRKDKVLEDYKGDPNLCFDKLGITTLVVDECQNYKNITMETKLENVVGLHGTGSKKADLLMDKVRFVQKNGGKIVFATGTLLTNSIADLFVFQSYLQPDTLDGCLISSFGEWANTFGSSTTQFEIDVNSHSFRYMTRISHYHNLPELMALFAEVCDFYHISKEDMDVPEFNGYTDVAVEASPYHLAYNEQIVKRTDAIRTGAVSMKEDNILKVVTDGRKAALDIRLVDDTAVLAQHECKAGACADKVYEIYNSYPDATQIVFCDYSTPKNEFNVYDELKSYLIAKGIPEKEIAFIHAGTTEAKKNKLLDKLDSGELKVMIGSTQKLGVGVNVQKHLIALHHLDAPWRPSDLTQREGRLIRQGNLNKEVFQFRYITTRSFDAYVWQILENKQRFIGSFLAGSMSEFHRTETDIDKVELDCSEVKAIAVGNPLIKQRVITANKLERSRIAQRQRKRELYDLRDELSKLPEEIKKTEYRLAVLNADRRYYRDHRETMPVSEREVFGEKLLRALKGNIMRDQETFFNSYMYFKVILPANMLPDKPYIIVRRNGGGSYKVDMTDKTPVSCTQAIDATLNGISKRIESTENQIEQLNKRMELTKTELAAGNPYDDEIEELKAELDRIDGELEKI